MFYQHFEKELLEQLTDQIKMQNMVYFQLKGSDDSADLRDECMDADERSESRDLGAAPSQPGAMRPSKRARYEHAPMLARASQAGSHASEAEPRERCLSPLANPQSGLQSANGEHPAATQAERQVTTISIGQDADGTKSCLLSFQIQVPPHAETQVLNICVYRDDHPEGTFRTDD